MIIENNKITYNSEVINEEIIGTINSKDTSLTALNIGSELSTRMGSNVSAILEKFDTLGNSGGEYSHIGISTKNIYRELKISTIHGIPDENGWIPMTKAEEYSGVDKTSTALGSAETFNAPFQFNPNDDVRSNPYFPNLGRVYNRYIRSNFRLAVFEVGRIKYANSFLEFLKKSDDGNHKQLKSFIRGDGRGLASMGLAAIKNLISATRDVILFPFKFLIDKDFAVFQSDTYLFKMYFDEMATELATVMGLADEKFNYLGSMDHISLKGMIPGLEAGGKVMNTADRVMMDYLPFLIHKGINISESISNSTDAHPLASQMNSESAAASAAKQTGGLDEMSIKNSSNFLSKILGAAGDVAKQTMAKAMTGETGYILSGDGRIILPDVWSNSSFSRSYTLNFKFQTPIGSDLAVFENTYLPFLILNTMSSPRQVGKMSYTSPFIIRVASKGWFTCPMGIVESFSIERGDEKNDITVNGFPRTIKISMSIKDLMPNMVMSMNAGMFSVLHSQNTGMRSYMSILGGMSIAEANNVGDRLGNLLDRFGLNFKKKIDLGEMMYSLSQTFPVKAYTRIVKNDFNSTPY